MDNLLGKKILITGGSGFLGSYLAGACFSGGALLYGIDLRSPYNVNIWAMFCEDGLLSANAESLFRKHVFDIVFHLSGSASVSDSVQFPEKDFDSILPPTLKLIQLIKTYCPLTHLILFSSAAVYGNPEILPIEESAELHPVSPYGIHKALAENLIRYYGTCFGLQTSILRIFSAYGEGLRRQLFWDIMCRYEKALSENKSGKEIVLELFGTGHESRDFIHCKDVVKAAILIATSSKEKDYFNIFNVAGGKETNVKDAVDLLFSKAPVKPTIVFSGAARAGDPEKWRADIFFLKQLGFNTTISLENGLNSYYTWFMEKDKINANG
jgi:nucleoside-diphosphate-sugar epimerase